jgi:hypothetical protein
MYVLYPPALLAIALFSDKGALKHYSTPLKLIGILIAILGYVIYFAYFFEILQRNPYELRNFIDTIFLLTMVSYGAGVILNEYAKKESNRGRYIAVSVIFFIVSLWVETLIFFIDPVARTTGLDYLGFLTVSLILSLLAAQTLTSKVLSRNWKMMGLLSYVSITVLAIYWAQDSLTWAIVLAVSVILWLSVIYYKIKIKKVAFYD